MALKFLNKKGWHTGSLRNIENVWKAEQKRDAEQKKLEELRKQIQEERERSEFRLLQEQAGLVPKQERLDFLYDSGLAVGKSNSDGFKALETLPQTETDTTCSSSKASVPGALFEEKPQSANDAWRKLHSDPLLLIRQKEQEALARVQNNPIQMAMIRKSVESNKDRGQKQRKTERKKQHKDDRSKHEKHSSSKDKIKSEKATTDGEERVRSSHHKKKGEKSLSKDDSDSEHAADEGVEKRKSSNNRKLKQQVHSSKGLSILEASTRKGEERGKRSDWNNPKSKHGNPKSKHGKQLAEAHSDFGHASREYKSNQAIDSIMLPKTNTTETGAAAAVSRQSSSCKHLNTARKLSEEERAARLREMQMDAQLHEEQRWKRLKKASEDDAREVRQVGSPAGQSFLDAARKTVYGAVREGTSTIEESVRRRTYYLQRQSEAGECNAFRR